MNCANSECLQPAGRRSGLCRKCYMRDWRYGTHVDRKAYLRADRHPTTLDIAWAAGFLEGEGSFRLNNKKRRVAQVVAVQVEREPLERIRSIFGGSNFFKRGRLPPRPPQSDYWYWQVNGARARGVMLTIYGLMSPKRRRQIRQALDLDGHFELVDP